jgi:LacI family transcriptional regulator
MARSLPIEGFILPPPFCDLHRLLDCLDDVGARYVRISPSHSFERASYVSIDDALAGRRATECLLSAGHTKIAFIRGAPGLGAANLRYRGYRGAMQDGGVAIAPSWIAQGDFSFESGMNACAQLLDGDDPPTAIFASNDDMALGAMSAAAKRGLAVPHDLSIIGFDDDKIARFLPSKLTTIRQPVSAIAYAAARILTRDAAEPPASNQLTFDLIMRESVGPPPIK